MLSGDTSFGEPTASIFIIGCPRSGTSALAWSLHEHQALEACEESGLFSYIARHVETYYAHHLQEGRWLTFQDVDLDEVSSYIGLGIDRLYLSRTSGKRWVDATPANTLVAHRLSRMFPRSSFLHLVRDGRAVVSSMINSGFQQPWATDFACAVQTWVDYVVSGRRFAASLPERTLEIRHEDLVSDARGQIRRVLGFLGLSPCDAPVRFLETRRINSSYEEGEGHGQGTIQELAGVDRWASWTRDQWAVFEAAAGGLMTDLGYSLDRATL